MKTEFRTWCISTVILMLLAVAFSGCSATTEELNLAGKAVDRIPTDIGRFSSHSVTRAAEEATKQKVVEMKKAMADAEKAQAEADMKRDAGVVVVLDTPEKISTWSLASLGKQLADSNKVMSKALQAFAEKGENPFQLATTPTPKGVIAESLDSFGHAVAKIGESPASIAGAVGVTAVKVAKEVGKSSGDKTTLNGDGSTVNLTKTNTNTKSESTAVGANPASSSNTSGAAPPAAQQDPTVIVDGVNVSQPVATTP